MKSSTQIVHGGGWLARQTVGRPKTRFFCFLSVIWLGVSICASYPFWHGWPQSFGALEWLGGLLLMAQPVLIILALAFSLTEQPRTITRRHPNPDHDIRKLY